MWIHRLGFVEIFGTGITRIKQFYEESLKKPDFEVSENTIKMVLPVLEKNLNLTEDDEKNICDFKQDHVEINQ